MSRWWEQGHSTEGHRVPDRIDTLPPTPEALYEWAESCFNFDEDRVRAALRAAGLAAFYPESWWTYVLLLKQEWLNDKARDEFPEKCPICGEAVQRDRTWDGLVGVRWGWKCDANRFHFMECRVNVLRTNEYANTLGVPDRQSTEEGSGDNATEPATQLTRSDTALD